MEDKKTIHPNSQKTAQTHKEATGNKPEPSASSSSSNFWPPNEESLIRLLVDLVTTAASTAQKARESENKAQLAFKYSEEVLSFASDVTDHAQRTLLTAKALSDKLLKHTSYLDYQQVFCSVPNLSTDYTTFLKVLQASKAGDEKGNTQLCPKKGKGGSRHSRSESRRRDRVCGVQCECAHRDSESHSQKRSQCLARLGDNYEGTIEADDENTDDEDCKLGKDTHHRKCQSDMGARKTSSHHKQVETVRKEEHMGGAYVLHRRRSPSDGLAGMASPLLTEDELTTIRPPLSRQGSSKLIYKVIRRDKAQENSDSDIEHLEEPPTSAQMLSPENNNAALNAPVKA
ncbi:uncharacterized protein LOC103187233 [Callorhinchus milii]|uniref:uncharacterized protein LOC103187233 n=1 Tax=Callorhinchus milii TaxID=7868 RepID=UPI0004574893|nr:uncharacterized protein LOC103187233 [Callorhinchus milii]|eukprot:gi/632976509/ref/XP_007904834.1/ PREDICTED: uncharacterized protein LOC103187233 [Callorhinchus milii]